MQARLRAIETTGTIDEQQLLHLDGPLPIRGPSRVRVIVLVPEEVKYDDHDIEEQAWLRAAARHAAPDILDDPEEDIYTLADGKPFRDEG